MALTDGLPDRIDTAECIFHRRAKLQWLDRLLMIGRTID